MKRFYFINITITTILSSVLSFSSVSAKTSGSFSGDSLPAILPANHTDFVTSNLRHEAIIRFASFQLPTDPAKWQEYRMKLKNEILKKAGVIADHKLPLNMKETGSVKMKGYSVKNIIFQVRPGVFATANLYVPDGKGPFPAIEVLHGHWGGCKFFKMFQEIGHSAALNGYVCLNIDAWGAGERSTVHGKEEYHGSNLGASLMNIGESLLGAQVSDNIRGIDLLCSLPYVDCNKIGATGASGGGNQTMWIAALDERVKASMPVVSVGSFESYIMRSNCVCELLVDGFTLSEESGIIALIAPRAIKMCNIVRDNPTFASTEMLRTYNNALPVFKMLNSEKNLSYAVLDTTHGYWPKNREIMLGWFDLHLKGLGDGSPVKEKSFELLEPGQLMVFPNGQRDPRVLTTEEYCKRKGNELRKQFLNTGSIDIHAKRNELKDILGITGKPEISEVHSFPPLSGWNRYAIETDDNKLIPLLHLAPANKSAGYTVICHPDGKGNIPLSLIAELKQKGSGIVIADLSGTGEVYTTSSGSSDRTAKLHTISRAEIWLGRTIPGEWASELNVITEFLKTRFNAARISYDCYGEAGLAALFLNATEEIPETGEIILRNTPVSYLFDTRENIDYFSMGIHLPGFLIWGDVSLAAALSGKNVSFIGPVTMSGHTPGTAELKKYLAEFEQIREKCKQPGKIEFR